VLCSRVDVVVVLCGYVVVGAKLGAAVPSDLSIVLTVAKPTVTLGDGPPNV
jgi:hypothetical protein